MTGKSFDRGAEASEEEKLEVTLGFRAACPRWVHVSATDSKASSPALQG